MRRSPCWRALGIDPTDNTRAIRRAYAAKLKTIDADADPQAFVALREAFEQAQREAPWIGQDGADEEDWDEEEWEATSDAKDDAAVPIREEAPIDAADLTPPAPSSPWAAPTPADYDAHARALVELLLGDHPEPWPNPDEIATMQRHWAAIRSDPRMEEMGFYADAEQWAAELIARSVPFSDPIIETAITHFGWAAGAGEIHQSHAVDFLLRRARMLAYLAELRDKRHPLHRAYVELTTPAQAGARRGWVRKSQIDELLAVVRRGYPDIEGVFEPERIGLWERPREWLVPSAVAGVFLLVALFFFLMPQASSPRRMPPLPVRMAPMTTSEPSDTARVLGNMFGGTLKLDAVEAENPELRRLIAKRWAESHAQRRDLTGYASDLAQLLDQRYQLVHRSAPLDMRAEMLALTLDEMKWLRRRNPLHCADYFQAKARAPEFPAELSARRNQRMVRVLLKVRQSSPPREKDSDGFSVPAEIVDKAAKRAGMDREALSATMRFEGPPERICDGRIALLETILAMPRAKTAELLRSM